MTASQKLVNVVNGLAERWELAALISVALLAMMLIASSLYTIHHRQFLEARAIKWFDAATAADSAQDRRFATEHLDAMFQRYPWFAAFLHAHGLTNRLDTWRSELAAQLEYEQIAAVITPHLASFQRLRQVMLDSPQSDYVPATRRGLISHLEAILPVLRGNLHASTREQLARLDQFLELTQAERLYEGLVLDQINYLLRTGETLAANRPRTTREVIDTMGPLNQAIQLAQQLPPDHYVWSWLRVRANLSLGVLPGVEPHLMCNMGQPGAGLYELVAILAGVATRTPDLRPAERAALVWAQRVMHEWHGERHAAMLQTVEVALAVGVTTEPAAPSPHPDSTGAGILAQLVHAGSAARPVAAPREPQS